jgi:hypothetical protein
MQYAKRPRGTARRRPGQAHKRQSGRGRHGARSLDRADFIAFCCVYGYLAFFTMDQLLPPFMQRNPVWPSTFPKVLVGPGIIVGLVVLFGLEGATEEGRTFATDINYRRCTNTRSARR